MFEHIFSFSSSESNRVRKQKKKLSLANTFLNGLK